MQNMTSQVFPVVQHCIPHLNDDAALSVKLLRSSETAVGIYCFMYYVKLLMIAQ
jgi:hypothetical protein